jgi:hypothetical protein
MIDSAFVKSALFIALVNSPENDTAACIQPLSAGQPRNGQLTLL